MILFLASVFTSFLGLAMMNQVSIWGAVAIQLFFAIVLAYLMTKRLALFQENEDESAFREKELQPLFRYEELLEKANLFSTVDEYKVRLQSVPVIKEVPVSSRHSESEIGDVNLSNIEYETFEKLEFIDLEARMAQEQEESRSQFALKEVAFMVEDDMEFIDRKVRVTEEKEEDRSQFVLEEAASTLEDELDFIDMKARMIEEQEEDKAQTSFETEDESNDFMKTRMKMFEELDEIQELSNDGRKNEEIEIEEKQAIADSAEKDEGPSPGTSLHSFEDLEERYLKNKQKKDRETV